MSPKKKDPYPATTKALRRGRAFAKKLLKMEGGVLTTEELMELKNLSLIKIVKMRQKRLLLFVRVEGNTFPKDPHPINYVYPRWQFDKKGRFLKGFRKVLETLNSNINISRDDDWSRFMFFLSKARGLEKTPLEELRRGNIKGVILAAQGDGGQGGW